MSVREEQPSNKFTPTEVIEDGIVTDVKEEQPSNG